MADTVCMPLLVAILTLLSRDIEGAMSRPNALGWRRGEASLLHRAIRRRAFQEYGGHQTRTKGGGCWVLAFTSANADAHPRPSWATDAEQAHWTNLRPLCMLIPSETMPRGRRASRTR